MNTDTGRPPHERKLSLLPYLYQRKLFSKHLIDTNWLQDTVKGPRDRKLLPSKITLRNEQFSDCRGKNWLERECGDNSSPNRWLVLLFFSCFGKGCLHYAVSTEGPRGPFSSLVTWTYALLVSGLAVSSVEILWDSGALRVHLGCSASCETSNGFSLECFLPLSHSPGLGLG